MKLTNHEFTGTCRVIITGGPGFGKSSLVGHLIRMGYRGFPEVARELIQDGFQAPIHQQDYPSNDDFFKQIYRNRMQHYEACHPGEICFYDRALPDSLAFFRFMNRRPPDFLVKAIANHPYYQQVFITPPWESLCKKDPVRRESFNEAVEIHQLIVQVYKELKYELVEVPLTGTGERTKYLLSRINPEVIGLQNGK